MFTNAAAPNTPYVGYLLASQLARPGAKLATLTTSDPSDVLGFQSVLAGGQVVVALINTSTSAAKMVSVSSSLAGALSTVSYSAAGQNSTNTKTVPGQASAATVAAGISLPAESILVLKGSAGKPSAMTLTSSAGTATIKAGTKVTISGKLSLAGAAAPAGLPVKITRQASRAASAASWTARTVAGGGFSVTDVPPGAGTYSYLASYASNTYLTATASVQVHVMSAKPSIKLAVSAKTVKPGMKVTVTATLGTPRVNRTLVIYAQVKGGAKKVIKRAAVNSKGQLSVVDPVTASTTFTVAFAGDSWYTFGSAIAVVST
jgi:hypothetical protein